MQKTKAKIITALLLTVMTLSIIPLAFASTGNIIINSTSGTQPLPITPVPAGGNITLYFGNVTFSGSQFYLLLSQDGFSSVSSGDIRYTPALNVADMRSTTTVLQVTDINYPGGWSLGSDWVNGSIPLNIAGGTYFIKAFDGFTTALAVTQGFTVTASLRIIPATGSAGTGVIVSGNAFPTNALVNLSYVSLSPLGNIVRFANLTQSNALGQFNYSMPAPDLMIAPAAGDSAPATNIIQFTALENATAASYSANYTENQRGLLQLGRPRSGSGATAIAGNLQNATGVYGNGTSFNLAPTIPGTTISVGVGDTFRVVGNSFYPGAVTMKWDNSIDLAPTANTANGTGYFNATFTVPGTGLGSHNITLIDSGLQIFAVYVNVVQSITISPTSGPIGTNVTVSGFGFPASGTPSGTVYNATITFGTSSTIRAASLTDANGQFTATLVVPTSPGGANNVTATTNDTSLTSAFKTFTVTANFTVSPASFYANSSSAAVASGTGFDPTKAYYVAIDNLFSPFSNTTNGMVPSSTGSLSFTFIQAGFQPGLHVIALYQVSGNNAPAANATFTVLADPLTSATGILSAINSTVTQTNTTVNTISTNLALIDATIRSINGTVVTLNTSVGTLTTTVNAINASITGINNGFATVQSTVGSFSARLSSISSTLSGVSGTVGTISTSLGTVTTSLSSINTKVTSISDGVATVSTDVGTIKGTVSSIQGNVATIQTAVGTLQADVSDLKTSVDNVPGQVSIPIWIAVILALIAAIAAIASLLLVRRKIAG
jgi:peptidoglycan hydrolase CwlO-like protein